MERPQAAAERVREHLLSIGDMGEGERRRIVARREALFATAAEREAPYAGLALSGGGIRSATFSLGLLREMAAQGLLHRFDYLSTVSGGSYVGSYYCALFAPRRSQPAVLKAGDFPDPFARRDGLGRASLDWLRQSGRYLAPSGAGDYWYAVALLIRNWLGVQVVIGASLLLLALLAAGVRYWLHGTALPPRLGFLLHGAMGWAPLLALLSVPVAVHVAFGWAYWMTKRDVAGTARAHVTAAQLGSAVICVGCLAIWRLADPAFASPRRIGAITLGIGLAAFAGLALVWISGLLARRSEDPEIRWDARREWLTRPLMWCALAFVAILAAAAADALGLAVYRFLLANSPAYFALPPVVVGATVPVARWLLGQLAELAGTLRKPAVSAGAAGAAAAPSDTWLKAGAAAAALLLMLVLVGLWGGVAYLVTWPAAAEGRALVEWDGTDALPSGWSWTPWLAWTGAMAVLAYFIARTPVFLNLSGLTSFYADRLRRAYLGAGNRGRIAPDRDREPHERASPDAMKKRALDRGEENDDVLLTGATGYYREGSAAPLHLINITLNETRGPGSNIVQRDRRGRNLVVSPEGIYYKTDRGDEVDLIGFNDDGHEMLPLSTWIAISGAAFSTGLGAGTRFPITQLAGLANVRLGYWWRARPWRTSTPTQWDLLREFRGDFSGPFGKFWYLSDGGHFENTGAYELIRRHLPFIVISDNGMDERFEYEDVANLVRKARIDFDCEINFCGSERLDAIFGTEGPLREAFGTQAQIAGAEPAAPKAVAALATATYADGLTGTIVIVKPRLTGDGPADLIRYKAANQAFPQQSTLDQFFDEAQWESYYHLGRLIAQAVFGAKPLADQADGPAWFPSSLRPIRGGKPD